MELRNTTLDDIASVAGFSATLRLVSWFGDLGSCYVPVEAKEGDLLVMLIGLPAARKLSEHFPGEYLPVPMLQDLDVTNNRGAIAKLIAAGFSTREVSHILRISERRVQQLLREMEVVGLIEPVGPAKRRGTDNAAVWWVKNPNREAEGK